MVGSRAPRGRDTTQRTLEAFVVEARETISLVFFSFRLAENILVFDVAAIAAAVIWQFFSENRKKATAHASALPYIA